MKPFCVKPGLTRTFGVLHELVQGSNVVPAGQERVVTQVLEVPHSVVPLGQAQAPQMLVYWPPAGVPQLAPTVELAAVQPPQGNAAVLQEQLAVEQLKF
jgi:hypothetical protein